MQAIFAQLPLSDFPDCAFLNRLAHARGLSDYEFVANQDLAQSNDKFAPAAELYYEEIIHQFHWIPTREENWHDWFNALIWLSFPKTKRLLNQLHIQDIQEHGLHPRSHLRNRLTLLDECGGILAYEDDAHLQALENHLWHSAFMDMRDHWHNRTKYFVFGHANYEMLLSPYIGLTGKYLPIKVDSDFWQLSLQAQYSGLDEALYRACLVGELLQHKGGLKPLPLLGIPGWYPDNDDPQFYANEDYFRPKRAL